MNYSQPVRNRLSYIERTAYWKESINRKDLCKKFEISIPQATQDFRDYCKLAPDNIKYDRKQKSYIPVFDGKFKFVFDENKPCNILSTILQKKDINVYSLSYFNDFAPDIYASLIIKSVFKTGEVKLDIKYQTMNSANPMSRKIVPVSLGFFGHRWHARAFCFNRNDYRDFVLSRIIWAKKCDEPVKPLPNDVEATSIATLIIRPHRELSDTQKKCIELEYNMEEGFASITVAKNKIIYLMDELNLLQTKFDSKCTFLELANRAAIEAEMNKNEPEK